MPAALRPTPPSSRAAKHLESGQTNRGRSPFPSSQQTPTPIVDATRDNSPSRLLCWRLADTREVHRDHLINDPRALEALDADVTAPAISGRSVPTAVISRGVVTMVRTLLRTPVLFGRLQFGSLGIVRMAPSRIPRAIPHRQFTIALRSLSLSCGQFTLSNSENSADGSTPEGLLSSFGETGISPPAPIYQRALPGSSPSGNKLQPECGELKPKKSDEGCLRVSEVFA